MTYPKKYTRRIWRKKQHPLSPNRGVSMYHERAKLCGGPSEFSTVNGFRKKKKNWWDGGVSIWSQKLQERRDRFGAFEALSSYTKKRKLDEGREKMTRRPRLDTDRLCHIGDLRGNNLSIKHGLKDSSWLHEDCLPRTIPVNIRAGRSIKWGLNRVRARRLLNEKFGRVKRLPRAVGCTRRRKRGKTSGFKKLPAARGIFYSKEEQTNPGPSPTLYVRKS